MLTLVFLQLVTSVGYTVIRYMHYHSITVEKKRQYTHVAYHGGIRKFMVHMKTSSIVVLYVCFD